MTSSSQTTSEATSAELLARALAAEATVEVLKRKVQDLYNGGSSVIHHAAERARLREAEMRRRQELAALRNAELARHSAALEQEVAARTRDLQTILDNVVFGFLIVDRDGTIRDGATRSCTALLGQAQLTGAMFAEAFGLPPRKRSEFALQLELLFDDVLPEELVVDQLPRRATSATGRSLQADARVIRHADGKIDGVLLTITDVTALEAAQRETEHFRTLVQILRQREAFEAFVIDFRALVDDARGAAADQPRVRRIVHTLKGNAACFGLTEVAEIAHAVEDAAVIDRAALERIASALDGFLAANADVLGMEQGHQILQIDADELGELERAVPRGASAVNAWIARVRCPPAHVLLGPIEALVPRLAERFGKQVDLVIEGGDLRVDAELLHPIVRELGHVVRNAIDHGIEPSAQRGGKPPAGQVMVRIAEDGTGYRIEVADDGGGIDVERVIARAREGGMCSERDLTGQTREQLLGLVFVEGLSTAEATTDVSGRGIGMSAIRNAVLGAGGAIRVGSEPGRGTRVEIVVPGRRHGRAAQRTTGSLRTVVDAGWDTPAPKSC
jgi:two-component system chemotaxis sensor kinase CheA